MGHSSSASVYWFRSHLGHDGCGQCHHIPRFVRTDLAKWSRIVFVFVRIALFIAVLHIDLKQQLDNKECHKRYSYFVLARHCFGNECDIDHHRQTCMFCQFVWLQGIFVDSAVCPSVSMAVCSHAQLNHNYACSWLLSKLCTFVPCLLAWTSALCISCTFYKLGTLIGLAINTNSVHFG